MALRSTSSAVHIDKLYNALTVRSRKMSDHLAGHSNYSDIHVLTMSLLHCLRNLPTSLLMDSQCRKWTQFICGAVDRVHLDQDLQGQSAKQKKLPRGMDHDLYALWSDPKRKEHLATIRSWILNQYQRPRSAVMDVLEDQVSDQRFVRDLESTRYAVRHDRDYTKMTKCCQCFRE